MEQPGGVPASLLYPALRRDNPAGRQDRRDSDKQIAEQAKSRLLLI